jgi:hypothetical protein
MRKTKNHHICLKCGYNRNYECTKPDDLCNDCIKFINDNPGNKKAKEYWNDSSKLNQLDLYAKSDAKTKAAARKFMTGFGPKIPKSKEWHRKTTFKARKVHKGNKVIITSEQVIVQGSLVYCKCSNCGKILHLECFGMREMDDGIIRNQPQCWECR